MKWRIVLIISALGLFALFVTIFTKYFVLKPYITYKLTSSHRNIQSGTLDQTVLNEYIDIIDFSNTKVLYAVREQLRVPRNEVKIIEFHFTDQPQSLIIVEGPNGEEVVSISHKYDREQKTWKILLYVLPEVLQRSADPTRLLNSQVLRALYTLRYLDYYDYIGNHQYDFYGVINKDVKEFMNIKDPPAQYEYIF